MNANINFFKESITFRLSNKEELRKWIVSIVKSKQKKIENLNFIFCSDPYLRKINKTYLEHDYFTDIVTFDNSSVKGKIEGDIFISIDRIRINAKQYKVTVKDELHRVIIHGVLHLLGYGDKNLDQVKKMRAEEDKALAKRKF